VCAFVILNKKITYLLTYLLKTALIRRMIAKHCTVEQQLRSNSPILYQKR